MSLVLIESEAEASSREETHAQSLQIMSHLVRDTPNNYPSRDGELGAWKPKSMPQTW